MARMTKNLSTEAERFFILNYFFLPSIIVWATLFGTSA